MRYLLIISLTNFSTIEHISFIPYFEALYVKCMITLCSDSLDIKIYIREIAKSRIKTQRYQILCNINEILYNKCYQYYLFY